MSAGGSADDKARELRDHARQLDREAANWERGAEGERRVASVLARLPDSFAVFHDLRLPSSRANVDHLVVGAGGVWAIDAKFYSHKVTRGTGAGADTLWTARKPLRETLRTTAWEATKVGELIGVDVWPMMCVIAPSIPETAFDFDGIRICEPRSLESQLFESIGAPVDVAGVTSSVRRVFSVEPDPRAVRDGRSVVAAGGPMGPSPRRQRSRRHEPATIRVGNPPRDWAKLFSNPLIRLAGLALFAMVALSVLPAVAGWGGERLGDVVSESARDFMPTTIARPSTTPLPTTTSISTTLAPIPFEEPAPVKYVTTCPTPGAGWLVNWVWPGLLPEGALGYRIRAQEADGAILKWPSVGLWAEPSDPLPPHRFDSTDYMIFTDLVGPDGNTAATIEEPFAAPTSTC